MKKITLTAVLMLSLGCCIPAYAELVAMSPNPINSSDIIMLFDKDAWGKNIPLPVPVCKADESYMIFGSKEQARVDVGCWSIQPEGVRVTSASSGISILIPYRGFIPCAQGSLAADRCLDPAKQRKASQ